MGGMMGLFGHPKSNGSHKPHTTDKGMKGMLPQSPPIDPSSQHSETDKGGKPTTTNKSIIHADTPTTTSSQMSPTPTPPRTLVEPTPQPTISDDAGGAYLSTQNTSVKSASSNQRMPTWAIPVVVVLGLMLLVFLASLAAFGSREWRRKKETTGEAAGGGGGRGKEPSYMRAVGRAGTVASGLFIPIWITKRYRRARGNGAQGRRKMLGSRGEPPAYGKLQKEEEEEGRARQSEDIVASTTATTTTTPATTPPPPAPLLAVHATTTETPVSPVSLERGNSMVSSLSSSTRSQEGRYERLDIPPSPMSEDAPYPWRSQDMLEIGSGSGSGSGPGSLVEKRPVSTETEGERPRSSALETPLARRSDSVSEKGGSGAG
ncbi:uncharacterized protein F4812DRAFT_380445 [Daldinia caldariorum]|uniref:uncharacterized protein n=1 Tax=Daldinia caldariorum TaxID=326644 RepID=UPI00200832D2|nr:uncharacterized protein F4812DRAFT_380445 [Daldinia caldariorum]KAI1467866.1 hypothetical protein F4812DRAFT_380445 [Daldinia caldariorum]